MGSEPRELVVRIGPDGSVRYRESDGLEACRDALGAELGPGIEDVEMEIREHAWVPVTSENSGGRKGYECWWIDCPKCGAGGIQMYGSSSDATVDCHNCGATVQFGVRTVDVQDGDPDGA